MLRSLVGSEMCIRDRYQRRVRGIAIANMVQLINVNAPTIWYRSAAYPPGERIRCGWDASRPLDGLRQEIGLGDGVRMVCKGCELQGSQSLEQQGCKARDTIYCLEPLPEGACAAWGRTGRCGEGGRCHAAQSHTMQLSPRYVEHRAAAMSAESSPSTSPPPSPSPSPQVVCRNWEANGTCRYGEQCFYAHTCLLYTSDAADEEDSVDLGGRRIIKKKKKKK
eukprot:TRINITY_DN14993_c0_g2_i3.p1 TRINITY_DN14993_c0_g2~~TRINITY_DN14993_c0_g2_i3.p1  ORF type:complete len:237 (-),score=72.13 TRINITY_DN14993_c0_g2_i3:59-724(-)